MDVLESPLNSAHQLGRKADRYEAVGKLEQAIQCHEKAAECLTDAMSQSSAEAALESMSLQRGSHLRQVTLLRDRKRRIGLAQEKLKRQAREGMPQAAGNYSGSNEGTDDPEVQVFRTMEECDSLLQFLNDRGENCVRDATESSVARMVEGSVKSPKDISQIVEELRIHNDALREHVLNFLDENSELRSENQKLRELLAQKEEEHLARCANLRRANDQLRKQIKCMEGSCDTLEMDNKYGPLPVGMSLDTISGLELAPLEMPTFDFDSLKTVGDSPPTQ